VSNESGLTPQKGCDMKTSTQKSTSFRVVIISAQDCGGYDVERFGADSVEFVVETDCGDRIKFQNGGHLARKGGWSVGDFLNIKRHGKGYAIKGVEVSRETEIRSEIRRHEGTLRMIADGPQGIAVSDGYAERCAAAAAEAREAIANLELQLHAASA